MLVKCHYSKDKKVITDTSNRLQYQLHVVIDIYRNNGLRGRPE